MIQLNFEDVEPIAREFFTQYSELGAGAKNHKILIEESLQVLDNFKSFMKIQVVLIPLPEGSYDDGLIFMERNSFSCTLLEEIEKHTVESIYAFLITLGECYMSTKNQAELYYQDVWINCFFEATKTLVRNHIKEQEKLDERGLFISVAYGPGTYGMPSRRINDMLDEVADTMVGRILDRDGNLPNQRLSGGFFLITNEESPTPPIDCKGCQGHEKGCMICSVQNVIPTRQLCMEILKSYGTPANVIAHSEEVTRTAMTIAKALVEKGYDLDLRLLEAAALLHDIARTEENHGLVGALALEKKGYRKVAGLVKCHMFYATDPFKSEITELDILCLADRMVKEDKFVGLEVRMGSVLDKLISKGVDTEKVISRIEENKLLKNRIEGILGKTVEALMAEEGNARENIWT